jgi:hypothetical protein
VSNTEKLAQIVKDHAVPDPSIVGKLPRGGTQLDYVGHAEVTRILLEIDPLWTIEPVAFDEAGLPAREKIGTMIQAGFWMTVLGHRRYCVGSVEDRKVDVGKELVSDGTRNGAMRFGVALSLWSKEEWGDQPAKPVKKAAAKKAPQSPERPPEAPQSDADTGDALISPELHGKFTAACMDKKIDPVTVAKRAGVDYTQVTISDMDKLRATFKEMTSK